MIRTKKINRKYLERVQQLAQATKGTGELVQFDGEAESFPMLKYQTRVLLVVTPSWPTALTPLLLLEELLSRIGTLVPSSVGQRAI
jgi:hypothetical protein